ncbi:MAG: hypothetical protein MJ207_00405 [Bacilli bacterium]|nr:hypothetical protein [Bacilli bacterium]
MQTIKDISEPRRAYEHAAEIHHQNVVDYFDQLLKDTKTDAAANKATCEDYYHKLTEIEALEKKARKKKRKRSFFKFLMIVSFILIILIPVGVLLYKKIKHGIDAEIKKIHDDIAVENSHAEELKGQAIAQLAALNDAYSWNLPAELVGKTIPLMQVDTVFDNKRYYQLHDKYGYGVHAGNDISTLYVQSGSIFGNPFVIEMNRVQEMVPRTYFGSLTVTYTVRTNVNGRTVTTTRTEILHAEIVKPAPYYYVDTWLIYGNDAAPKLNFTRMPGATKDLSAREIAKLVKKSNKELAKRSKKDHEFTKMGNSEFEALFNATDRDNEVEFRLLFTPLAQRNMLHLIKTPTPYGDDFCFVKRGPLNYIKTRHAQTHDYRGNPLDFLDFDLAKAREKFITRCDEYFKNFYFDMAPLMCVPLYQNYKAKEYIYKDNHADSNVTAFETESLANAYDVTHFMPKDSATEAILKTELVKKEKDHDLVNIVAHAFKSIPQVEMVPRVAGNGRTYMVPVTWYQYLPVSKKTPLMVGTTNDDRKKFISEKHEKLFANSSVKDVYYQKGLVSALFTAINTNNTNK